MNLEKLLESICYNGAVLHTTGVWYLKRPIQLKKSTYPVPSPNLLLFCYPILLQARTIYRVMTISDMVVGLFSTFMATFITVTMKVSFK